MNVFVAGLATVRSPYGPEVWRLRLSLGASKPATHGRFKTSRGVNVQ